MATRSGILAAVAALCAIPAMTATRAGAAAPKGCAATSAPRSLPAIVSLEPRKGAPRVFAMQYHQLARSVLTYGSFRKRIDCMIRRYVVPRLAKGRPNVVVFNEDVGLMTSGTGSRGKLARRELRGGSTITLLGDLKKSYARQDAYYRTRFPNLDKKLGAPLVLATDTAARGWMQTFSDLARRYKVYLVGSSDQPRFRASRSAADIRALADPDIPRPKEVYVATSDRIYNEVFMWGPRSVRKTGPPMLRNVVARNLKVPLTSIEKGLKLTPGPAHGAAAIANLRPYRLPGTKARLGFATSLPAFEYGPRTSKPCADTAVTYMRCLDHLGTNVVIQDEANPGAWAIATGTVWQPLDWMGSTWRAVADPTVHFTYAVDLMLVGNLGDLVFDGQSAITQRGLHGRTCRYVGNTFAPEDRATYRASAGPKPQFLALAPWVAPDASRTTLRAIGAKLAPASGDPIENEYLETALIADLPFPADTSRPGCRTARPPAAP